MSSQRSTPSDPDDSTLLLAASREILLLVDGDSLHIVNANAAASRMLGYAPQTLRGMPLGDLECALSDMFFWDEMRDREQATADSAYRCADGSVLEVAKQVTRVSTQPLRYAVCATSTEQHYKVASELNTMASRLRATLEATADGILLVDNGGAILNMNRRFSALWDVPDDLLQRRDDAGIMAHLQSQIVREERDGDQSAPEADGDDSFATQYLKNGRVL